MCKQKKKYTLAYPISGYLGQKNKRLNLLKKTIRWVLGTVLVVILLVYLFISLPFFQRWMAGEVASYLSDKLHTRVEIGRIQVSLLGRLIIDDINVWDRSNRPLLSATRTGAQLDLMRYFNDGHIIINSAQLYGVKANISQAHPDSALNYQFILDAFASKDTTKKTTPHIEVNSILARHVNVTFNREWQPLLTDRLDPNHLELKDLSLKASVYMPCKDSIKINLDKFSFEEKSGFKVSNLECSIEKNKNDIRLRDLSLSTNKSHLDIPMLSLSDNKGNGSMSFSMNPSDFACILPELRSLDETWNISLEGNGDRQTINLSQLTISQNNGALTLRANATVDNWKDSTSVLDANINQLSFNTGLQETIQPILAFINKDPQKASQQGNTIEGLLTKLDDTDLNGHITIAPSNIKANISATSGLGDIEALLSYKKNNLVAQAKTTNLQIGRLMTSNADSIAHPDQITAEVNLNAILNGKSGIPEGTIKATIQDATFRGYNYHDIAINASRKGDNYNANIISNDPSARLEADIRASLAKNAPYIQGFANIEELNLQNTHLSQSSRIQKVTTRVGIDLEGNELSNMGGHISIPHIVLTNADTTITLTNLQLISNPDGKKRHITFSSPYASLHADGSFEPASLVNYIQEVGHSWLPDVINATQKHIPHTDANFHATLINLSPLEPLTGMDIQFTKGPMMLDATMQSDNQMIEASVKAPSFTFNGTELLNLNAKLNSENRDMKTHVRMEKTMKGIPVEFNLDVSTQDERLTTRFRWNNHQPTRNYGELMLRGTMERNTEGGLAVVADVQPSQVYINDTVWNVKPTQLYFRDGRLYIDDFHFSTNNDEHGLAIHGTASALEQDSLHIDVRDIDLDYIFSIVRMKPISLSGYVTGSLTAQHVFKNPVASGNVVATQFRFNQASMGTANVYLSWGDTPGSLTLHGNVTDVANNSNIKVDGKIHVIKDPVQHLDLDITHQRANLAFLQRYLNNFIEDIQGRASGHTHIYGTFRDVDLETDALCHEAAFTIKSLGTRYHIEKDSIYIRPGRIDFDNITAYDRDGSPGRKPHSVSVNGSVTYDHFRNTHFNFDFNANHILAYDKKDFGDMTFYATIWADGNVKMSGQPGRTDINVDATPVGKSSLTYNTAGPTNITKAGFLTYVDRSELLKAQLEGVAMTEEVKKTAGDIYINFNLHLTPDAELRLLMDSRNDDAISLFGNCSNLHATYYNKGRFQMYGNYRVDHGTYRMTIQDVLRKDFRFREGSSIVFGGNPFSADLNLKAAYTVPSVSLNDLSAKGTFSNSNVRVDCIMNIGGTAGSPQVTFDFDIPNVNEDERRMVRSLISTEEERNMQVIYLLGIGRFYTYDYSGEQAQSTTAMNSLLSSTLSDQLNQVFNSLTSNTNWNFGANLSTGTMGWSDMDVEGMLSGRLLNNRLLINGSFGYRDNPVAASNFIGDFDVRYLVNKSGSVTLKAYSETNDRYFTKSALTTQGIGVMFKKDFDRLNELFSFLKRKKKSTSPETNSQTDKMKENTTEN